MRPYDRPLVLVLLLLTTTRPVVFFSETTPLSHVTELFVTLVTFVTPPGKKCFTLVTNSLAYDVVTGVVVVVVVVPVVVVGKTAVVSVSWQSLETSEDCLLLLAPLPLLLTFFLFFPLPNVLLPLARREE